MPNGERIHQLADSHAQGSHDSDPQFDCYDCPPEDVPTVLRRMFSETIKLGESWEADGNRMMSDFEHGKFITESLDEWAYNFSALADEYESATSTSFRNNPSPRREWRDDWKDYTDDLDIPKDWQDVTWHNNELPSFIVNGYHIWMNAPTLKERLDSARIWSIDEDWRFAVNLYNEEDAEIIYPEDGSDSEEFRTLDFDAVVAFVSKPRA